MDTFKGQDNDAIANLCKITTVSHNLINKFSPRILRLIPCKCFISKNYNKWFAEQVVNQLNERKNPADVDLTLKLSEVKPPYAKWIVQMFEYLNIRRYLIFHGFDSVGITEAVEKCNNISNREEYRFGTLKLWTARFESISCFQTRLLNNTFHHSKVI